MWLLGRLSGFKNHTSWVAFVTQTVTDRPNSVCSRCVIEVFGGVFCVAMLIFGFFCGCRDL